MSIDSLDLTPATREGWLTDAAALDAIADDLDADRDSDWCNTDWLRGVAMKLRSLAAEPKPAEREQPAAFGGTSDEGEGAEDL